MFVGLFFFDHVVPLDVFNEMFFITSFFLKFSIYLKFKLAGMALISRSQICISHCFIYGTNNVIVAWLTECALAQYFHSHLRVWWLFLSHVTFSFHAHATFNLGWSYQALLFNTAAEHEYQPLFVFVYLFRVRKHAILCAFLLLTCMGERSRKWGNWVEVGLFLNWTIVRSPPPTHNPMAPLPHLCMSANWNFLLDAS